jgi:acyl carrier protein
MLAVETVEDFTRFIARVAGLASAGLDADLPICEQTDLSSLQMIELAMAIEQECGIDLPDDIDLRKAKPADLFSPHASMLNQGSTSG